MPDDGEAGRLSVVAQVERLDPRRLEALVPLIRTPEERTAITARCRDADVLPKVADAGAVVREPDGTMVQIMHNGVRVLAGGYYGGWMQDLITRCRGHHEPQEEVLFAEIMRHLGDDAVMFELGGFWSFYSIWFLRGGGRRRSFVVEADPAHLEVGRVNAALNGCAPVFIPGFIGSAEAAPSLFQTEESGAVELPCLTVPGMMARHAIEHLDLLHCDAQGVELGVLESCAALAAAGRLGWVMVSTHTHRISRDPLTHQRCLAVLRQAGATILAEHDVQESFSGDGLIVARFGPVPAAWRTPRLSYNRCSESLFRNPLYDLAALAQAAPVPAAAPATPFGLLDASPCLAARGGMLTLTAACALGAPGDSIVLPFDRAIFPTVAPHGAWAPETQEFLRQRLEPDRRYVVLDIGANVGLFTRQAARHPNLARFHCIEAEAGNFRALRYNVGDLLGERVSLWNVALSDRDGEATFFRDDENAGNYSLNQDAMRGRRFDTTPVRAVETGGWMREHVRPEDGDRLVWKSDTQGCDELIVSRTPMQIWDRVELAVIELWRIGKPAFDRDAFRRRIEAFPNKSIGLGQRHATDDVLAFLSGEDWQHADLYLWR